MKSSFTKNVAEGYFLENTGVHNFCSTKRKKEEKKKMKHGDVAFNYTFLCTVPFFRVANTTVHTMRQ